MVIVSNVDTPILGRHNAAQHGINVLPASPFDDHLRREYLEMGMQLQMNNPVLQNHCTDDFYVEMEFF